MAIKTLYYQTNSKLPCCSGAGVILCVAKSLVNTDQTSDNNMSGFVTGTIQNENNYQNQCFGNYWQYSISYDDSELADGVNLDGGSVTGAICKSCITEYMVYLATTLGGGGGG